MAAHLDWTKGAKTFEKQYVLLETGFKVEGFE